MGRGGGAYLSVVGGADDPGGHDDVPCCGGVRGAVVEEDLLLWVVEVEGQVAGLWVGFNVRCSAAAEVDAI